MKLWCLPCLLGQGHTFHDDQSPNLAYNLDTQREDQYPR